jgi:hypothetical protein
MCARDSLVATSVVTQQRTVHASLGGHDDHGVPFLDVHLGNVTVEAR